MLADITIFLILSTWLYTKQSKVLWFYWASPILFYINYVHGQLDVIPMALLFVALALLFQKRFLLGFIVLGIGLATKTHLIAVVPFFFNPCRWLRPGPPGWAALSPLGSMGLCSGLRESLGHSPSTTNRIEFTARPPSGSRCVTDWQFTLRLLSTDASLRRSCLRLQAGERWPDRDFHPAG